MATSSSPTPAPEITFSYFRKTVSLREWWLTLVDNDSEGNRLAVSGFTCGEERALRVFNSAPITKRRDFCTLESADGILIILQGFINQDLTAQNGFSSQVSSEFLFGFPPNWEDCTEKYLKQSCIDSINNSGTDKETNDSENECEENRDGLKSGIASTLTVAQSPQTLLGCINEEVVVPKESSFKLPADCQDADQPANHTEDPSMSLGEQIDDITPSNVKSKRDSNDRLYNRRTRSSGKFMEDLRNNQSPRIIDVSQVKHKNKNKGIKKCSHSTIHADSDIQQKMLKASRVLRSSSDKLKSHENTEKIINKGGSASRKAKRRIVFDTPVESPHTQEGQEKKHIVSPDSFKRSRSGRILLPALQFWRNQVPIYDVDRSVTGIQEELSSSTGYTPKKPQKKQRKRR